MDPHRAYPPYQYGPPHPAPGYGGPPPGAGYGPPPYGPGPAGFGYGPGPRGPPPPQFGGPPPFRPGPPMQHFDHRPPFGPGPGMEPPRPLGSPAHSVRPDVGPPVVAPPPKPLTAEDKSTTVFVGSIADGVSDLWMERILKLCGPVRNWRRMQDATGKPKGFGFCVYENAESVSRALRVLGGEGQGELARGIELAVPGGAPKTLKLNVDEVARKHLEQYRASRMNHEDEGEDKAIREQLLVYARQMRDDAQRMDVDSFLHSIPDGGSTRPGSPTPSSAPGGKEDLDDLPPEMPPEQRELISREISMFRERSAQKDRLKKEYEERIRMERVQREKREDINRIRRLKQGENGYHGHSHEPRVRVEDEYDEEEEHKRQERRKWEAQQAFNERVSRWEKEEQGRIAWLTQIEKDKERDKENLAARVEELNKILPEWDEDAHVKTDEDRRAFFARIHRSRRKEIDRDQQDREDEQAELARKELEPQAPEEDEETKQEIVIGRIMTKEERVQAIQDLIGIIPTEREGLWTWSIKWDFLDETIMNSKLRPWIKKKVIEYIGEEEKDLIEFVTELLVKRTSADNMLAEMQGALDEEAEEFVMMLWRMLIYETESRSQGLG
ncbi:hypothetical protein SpCBS45565_g05789 [Spizellomyces sp. 'palustris']|nr:hypothetical protein SpCBS45565_g05789 [Spizellomyces sp. 'palustris']